MNATDCQTPHQFRPRKNGARKMCRQAVKKPALFESCHRQDEFGGFRPGQHIFSHLSAALIFFVTFLDQAKKVRQRKRKVKGRTPHTSY